MIAGSDKEDLIVSAEKALTEASEAASSADEQKTEYLPESRIDRLRLAVYKNLTAQEMLKISSYAAVAITAYLLFYRFMLLLEAAAYREMLGLAAMLAIPFVLVSILRAGINAPRPYELLPFYEKAPKHKSGRSFPSRHIFSVFVIAVALMQYSILSGAVLILVGVVMAFARVALGIHFVRDAVAGAAIGIISGIVGLIIL